MFQIIKLICLDNAIRELSSKVMGDLSIYFLSGEVHFGISLLSHFWENIEEMEAEEEGPIAPLGFR